MSYKSPTKDFAKVINNNNPTIKNNYNIAKNLKNNETNQHAANNTIYSKNNEENEKRKLESTLNFTSTIDKNNYKFLSSDNLGFCLNKLNKFNFLLNAQHNEIIEKLKDYKSISYRKETPVTPVTTNNNQTIKKSLGMLAEIDDISDYNDELIDTYKKELIDLHYNQCKNNFDFVNDLLPDIFNNLTLNKSWNNTNNHLNSPNLKKYTIDPTFFSYDKKFVGFYNELIEGIKKNNKQIKMSLQMIKYYYENIKESANTITFNVDNIGIHLNTPIFSKYSQKSSLDKENIIKEKSNLLLQKTSSLKDMIVNLNKYAAQIEKSNTSFFKSAKNINVEMKELRTVMNNEIKEKIENQDKNNINTLNDFRDGFNSINQNNNNSNGNKNHKNSTINKVNDNNNNESIFKSPTLNSLSVAPLIYSDIAHNNYNININQKEEIINKLKLDVNYLHEENSKLKEVLENRNKELREYSIDKIRNKANSSLKYDAYNSTASNFKNSFNTNNDIIVNNNQIINKTYSNFNNMSFDKTLFSGNNLNSTHSFLNNNNNTTNVHNNCTNEILNKDKAFYSKNNVSVNNSSCFNSNLYKNKPIILSTSKIKSNCTNRFDNNNNGNNSSNQSQNCIRPSSSQLRRHYTVNNNEKGKHVKILNIKDNNINNESKKNQLLNDLTCSSFNKTLINLCKMVINLMDCLTKLQLSIRNKANDTNSLKKTFEFKRKELLDTANKYINNPYIWEEINDNNINSKLTSDIVNNNKGYNKPRVTAITNNNNLLGSPGIMSVNSNQSYNNVMYKTFNKNSLQIKNNNDLSSIKQINNTSNFAIVNDNNYNSSILNTDNNNNNVSPCINMIRYKKNNEPYYENSPFPIKRDSFKDCIISETTAFSIIEVNDCENTRIDKNEENNKIELEHKNTINSLNNEIIKLNNTIEDLLLNNNELNQQIKNKNNLEKLINDNINTINDYKKTISDNKDTINNYCKENSELKNEIDTKIKNIYLLANDLDNCNKELEYLKNILKEKDASNSMLVKELNKTKLDSESMKQNNNKLENLVKEISAELNNSNSNLEKLNIIKTNLEEKNNSLNKQNLNLENQIKLKESEVNSFKEITTKTIENLELNIKNLTCNNKEIELSKNNLQLEVKNLESSIIEKENLIKTYSDKQFNSNEYINTINKKVEVLNNNKKKLISILVIQKEKESLYNDFLKETCNFVDELELKYINILGLVSTSYAKLDSNFQGKIDLLIKSNSKLKDTIKINSDKIKYLDNINNSNIKNTNDLKSNIIDTTNKLDLQIKKVNELNNIIVEKDRKIVNQNEEIKNNKEQINLINSKYNNSINQISSLDNKINNTNKILKELENENELNKITITEKEKLISKLNNSINELNTSLKEKNNDLNKKSISFDKLINDIKDNNLKNQEIEKNNIIKDYEKRIVDIKEELNERINKYNLENQKLNKDNSDKIQVIKDYKSTVINLEKENKDLNNKNSCLDKQIKVKSEEISNLNTKIKQIDSLNIENESKIKLLCSNIEILEKDINQLDSKNKDEFTENKKLKLSIDKLNNSIIKLETKNSSFIKKEEDNLQLINNLKNTINNYKKIFLKNKEEFNKIISINIEKDKFISNLNIKLDDTSNKLTEINSIIDDINKKNENKNYIINNLNSKIKSIEYDKKNEIEKLNSLIAKEINLYENRLNNLDKLFNEIREDIKITDSNIKKNKETNSILTTISNNIDNELKISKEFIDNIIKDLLSYEKKIEDLNNLINNSSLKNNDLLNINKDLTQTNNNLQDVIENKTKDLDILNKDISFKDEKIKFINNENIILKEDKMKLLKEQDKLKLDNKALKEEISLIEEKNKNYNIKLDNFEKDLSNKSELIKSKELTINELNININKLNESDLKKDKELDNKNTCITNLQDNIQHQKNEIKKLESIIEEYKTKYDTENNKNILINQNIKNITIEYDKKESQLKKELDTQKSKVLQYEDTIKNINIQREKSEEENNNYINDLEILIKDKDSIILDLNNKIIKINELNQNYINTIDNLNNKIVILEENILKHEKKLKCTLNNEDIKDVNVNKEKDEVINDESDLSSVSEEIVEYSSVISNPQKNNNVLTIDKPILLNSSRVPSTISKLKNNFIPRKTSINNEKIIEANEKKENNIDMNNPNPLTLRKNTSENNKVIPRISNNINHVRISSNHNQGRTTDREAIYSKRSAHPSQEEAVTIINNLKHENGCLKEKIDDLAKLHDVMLEKLRLKSDELDKAKIELERINNNINTQINQDNSNKITPIVGRITDSKFQKAEDVIIDDKNSIPMEIYKKLIDSHVAEQNRYNALNKKHDKLKKDYEALMIVLENYKEKIEKGEHSIINQMDFTNLFIDDDVFLESFIAKDEIANTKDNKRKSDIYTKEVDKNLNLNSNAAKPQPETNIKLDNNNNNNNIKQETKTKTNVYIPNSQPLKECASYIPNQSKSNCPEIKTFITERNEKPIFSVVDSFSKLEESERNFNEQLILLKSELKETRKMKEMYRKQYEDSIKFQDSRQDNLINQLKSALQNLVLEATLNTKAKNLAEVMMKILNFKEEEIKIIFDKKKKTGFFSKK